MRQFLTFLSITLIVVGIVAVVYLTVNANRQQEAVNITPIPVPQVQTPNIQQDPVTIDIPKPIYHETPVSVDIPKQSSRPSASDPKTRNGSSDNTDIFGDTSDQITTPQGNSSR